ncbi:ribonuclease P protein component [Helcococcus kunzii]|uniref:Ribonuclease P protein component n=1 Tax=Helcococcus kunzii ATCC 51366 TaxID=883114 RepID=H3NQU4_9FIRM|nr:ribonuclease P protein component [Helcococcus kunzii]EHR32091.1 ribonuclease P protein component [Helcococcus kunzii ATCC 51366]MCT1796844.1 ribonuclease P protein component [Helcococcus kunzii]MCT1988402.1 ribonuclease P protein component [Helcococcus kunzii]QUY65557.1 ribonuclease P protein component [Helcococcus kunzii]QZO76206.1 ribonuclease P protein component [Helcococcus kunzii]
MEKKYRIKKNLEFKRLYERSKRFYNRDFKILVSDNIFDYPRFGFTLTRKFGKANKRNRVRRLLKEIIRLNIDKFENGKDYIISPKSHTIEYEYKDLENSLMHIINISKRNK